MTPATARRETQTGLSLWPSHSALLLLEGSCSWVGLPTSTGEQGSGINDKSLHAKLVYSDFSLRVCIEIDSQILYEIPENACNA